jgi:hypothetical protein
MLLDGVGVQAGDRIEMSSSIATALNVPPGVWFADSDRQITLEKAPVYALTSPWDCGAPWAFRVDTETGELVGLAPITFSVSELWNKNPSGQIKSAARLFDPDFWNMADHALISWGGVRITFAETTIRRMAIRTQSVKVPRESYKPSRFKIVVPNGSTLTSQFYNVNTGVQSNGSVFTFALASTEIWATKEMNLTVTQLSMDDESNSRGYTSICSYGDLDCRISIKGEFPPTGAEIEVSEAVAEDFFPKIDAGKYALTANGANEQWRLLKVTR